MAQMAKTLGQASGQGRKSRTAKMIWNYQKSVSPVSAFVRMACVYGVYDITLHDIP